MAGSYERRPLLRKAQGGRCVHCWGKLRKHGVSEDHVVPLSVLRRSRSSGNRWNALLLHKGCNMKKADRLPTDDEMMILSAINIILHAGGYR